MCVIYIAIYTIVNNESNKQENPNLCDFSVLNAPLRPFTNVHTHT